MHVALLTASYMLCGEGCRNFWTLECSSRFLQDGFGLLADTETRAGTALPKIVECFALGFESFVLGPLKASHLHLT